MKILFLSAVLPYPLQSGGQIRMYNLLSRLAKHHEITLVSFIRNEDERQYLPALNFCKEVHLILRGKAWQPKYLLSTIFGKFSFLLTTYKNPLMIQKIRDLLVQTDFDAVHIEPFYVWPSLPPLPIPLVISEHNVEHEVYGQYVKRFSLVLLRPFLWIDVIKLAYWEGYIWRKAKAVTAVSTEDATQIEKIINTKISVVPNGVDSNHFTYRANHREHKAPHLLFVGDFRWFPNTDALRVLLDDIWPLVQKEYIDAELRIVGRHLSSRLKNQITKVGGQVAENVSDISVEYRNADILVAPHGISGGTKFKMLEAMSSGLPIVTTSAGAAGLDLVPNKHYLLAESASDFVNQVRSLWENKTRTTQIARAARAHVEKNFTWDAIAKKLDTVWKSI